MGAGDIHLPRLIHMRDEAESYQLEGRLPTSVREIGITLGLVFLFTGRNMLSKRVGGRRLRT